MDTSKTMTQNYDELWDKKLELHVLVAQYRQAIKDFTNRNGTPEAVMELLVDVERAELSFKRNEGKG